MIIGDHQTISNVIIILTPENRVQELSPAFALRPWELYVNPNRGILWKILRGNSHQGYEKLHLQFV